MLEEALADYDGTLLVVSHDRYFLDRVATKILALDGGRGTLYSGNYTDLHDRLLAPAPVAAAPVKAAAKPVVSPSSPAGDKAARASEHDAKRARDRELEKKRRRLKELEDKITGAESELSRLAEGLVADHAGDWQRLHTLVAEKEAAEARLAASMAAWEKLSLELGEEA